MKKTGIGLGILAATLNVHAISYDASLNGVNAPAGAHFVATGGGLEIKDHNSYKGLGVSGGASGAEIDLGQKLTITFDQPQLLNDLSLAFLYDGPEYSDGRELAAIKINGTQYTLTAVGPTSVTWTGSGIVQNISPATSEGAAIWKILNPAGNTAVNTIELFPLPYPTGFEAPNPADFSLRAFNTTSVPDAGSSAALLGLGSLALVAMKRRMK